MNETVLLEDPIEQFKHWYKEACGKESFADAMSLATVSQEGHPSVRIVLYKGISEQGFLFYTNYDSRKAQELKKNPNAAVVFYWPLLYRQVRIEGVVKPLSVEDSEAYFQGRPYDSQISAWASEQSKKIENRAYLLERYQQYKEKFDHVPCPPFWGGYSLIPNSIEFWVGHSHRLHERFLYQKNLDFWEMSLLAP